MVAGSTGSYTVLARRFRPQGFADVVGQGHVAQALRNAILANRVAHAYLFTGARGVGKTSTARILAKALNCPNSDDGNPCNKCEICEGIAAGNDVDVLEIDGASNRGIDDIRQLRANVNVKSMRTQYKLYIIDEVHMLTKEAFNALLKTLEEPPPNVKFVFCTTEPNKVPDTILSRCQRFDFGTIETSNIKDRLAHIAQAEGVEVDDEALELVARRAAGSMRDSQSIFDQLLAFGEEHVSAHDVHRLLGTASDDRLIDIGQSLVDRDQAKVMDSFHVALDEGVQLGELTDQLLFYLRDLMILASKASSVGLLSVAPVSRERLQKQAESWGLQAIVAAMQILSDAKGRMQRVTCGRALAELALVRIAMLEELSDINELIDRLRSREPVSPTSLSDQSSTAEKKNEIEPVQPAVAATETAEEADVPPRLADAVPAGESAQESQSSHGGEDTAVEEPVALSSSDQGTAGPSVAGEGTESAAGNTVPQVGTAETGAFADRNEPQQEPEVSADSESNSGTGAELSASSEEGHSAASAEDREALDRREASPGKQGGGPAQQPAPEFAFIPENSARIWARVVPETSDMLQSAVKSVSSTAIFAPNRLELTLPPRYHLGKTYLEKPDAQRRLQQIVARLTGVEPGITVVLSTEPVADAESAVAGPGSRQPKRVFKPEEDELVCSVVEVFAAQVVRIDPLAGGVEDGE